MDIVVQNPTPVLYLFILFPFSFVLFFPFLLLFVCFVVVSLLLVDFDCRSVHFFSFLGTSPRLASLSGGGRHTNTTRPDETRFATTNT